jgi:transcriptional regulator with XRE-family HTH domain
VRQIARVDGGRDWKNLARHVRRRRVELGYSTTRQFAGALGISFRTIGNLERGQPVGGNTLVAVERLLRWSTGAVDELLAGGEPGRLVDVPKYGTLRDPVSAVRAKIINASPDELVEMRSLVEEVQGREAADEWLRKALALREAARDENAPGQQGAG